MKETPFERVKLDVCLAAEQWVMHRTQRGIPHTKSLRDAEQALEKAATEFLDVKIAMIKEHIQAARAASPDGMTSWDRVEKFRLEHGHLPGPEPDPNCDKCKGEL